MTIEIRALGPFHLAYMRHVGPYGASGIPELWEKLRAWMEPRGLATDQAAKLGIGYDDPSITPPDKCRYDACVVVPREFAADRWVNVMDLPAGQYAVSAFRGTAREIGGVWDRIFSAWLPGSGYQPDERPCIEVDRDNPMVGDEPGVFRCDLCLPVRPL